MKPKGGRGHTAPYSTQMVRTPIPLKNQVEEIITEYREFVSAGGDPLNPPKLLEELAYSKPGNELKAVESTEQQILRKAIKSFVIQKRQQYGTNNAQKHKPFSTASRSWDYFKEFAELAEISLEELL